MTKQEYWDNLPVPKREKVYLRQMQLANEGFADEADHRMLTCWNKAIQEAMQKEGIEIHETA